MAIFRRKSSTGRLEDAAVLAVKEQRATVLLEEQFEDVRVVLFGLAYRCWRCQLVSTALVAFGEDVDGLCPEDLVLCNKEGVLALADGLVTDELRVGFSVGVVKPRYSRTLGHAYLSNGCHACDAIFGEFPLLHEELPEVLALEGLDGLVRASVSRFSVKDWNLLLESRWS